MQKTFYKFFFIPSETKGVPPRLIDVRNTTAVNDIVMPYLASLRGKYGEKVIVGTTDEYKKHVADAMRTAPAPITASAFQEALEILPPVGFRRVGQQYSFAMSELLVEQMTRIYAFDGEQHWMFVDDASIGHDAIMARVKDEAQKSAPRFYQVIVTESGDITPGDEGVAGAYDFTFDPKRADSAMTEGEVAVTILDAFHDKAEIENLGSFDIMVVNAAGEEIEEAPVNDPANWPACRREAVTSFGMSASMKDKSSGWTEVPT
jgi:hypothetical protein